MDAIEDWSERIARRAAPDEVDFAAAVGAAYAEGGRARKNLFARKGVQPGAFGPGASAADLPAILHALAGAGAAILALLRGPWVTDAIAAGALLSVARRNRGASPAGLAPDTVATGHEADPAQADPAQADPAQASELSAVAQALGQLSDRLQAAGFAQARAEQLAGELLAELLTDATGAASFVDALTAAPATSRRPGPGGHGRRSKARDSWPPPRITGP